LDALTNRHNGRSRQVKVVDLLKCQRRTARLYIDVPQEGRGAELAFLQTEIYRGEVDLLVRRIDAHDRFSERC
jgi:hypothetical protein